MSKENITQLGFGAMRLPLLDKNNQASINMDEFNQMVDYYIDQGFNYFDTSYAYHNEKSENALKEALVKRYPRDSYKIADKIPTWLLTKPKDNERLVNIMLERLGIDYFDVLLIHNINKVFIDVAKKNNSFDFLVKAKKEGIAKKIGISFHDKADLLEEILEEYSDILDIVQIQLNYLDWDDNRIQSKKCYDLCVKYGVEIVVMEPIKGGTLVNLPKNIVDKFDNYDSTKSLAYWALRFVSSLDNVSVVLSGMGSYNQMKENCDTLKIEQPLTQEENNFLLNIVNDIKDSVAINCSFCNYCVKDCPMNIPIPDFFNLYNSEKLYHLQANVALYGSTAKSNAPASACIKCGKCIEYCTQQLNIPELLEDVAELFE